jgi:hypothetical protein
VITSQKVAAANETFTIWVFFDPLYRDPLVLGTNLTARPETVFRLFLDRWPVEQVPLVAQAITGPGEAVYLCPSQPSAIAGTGPAGGKYPDLPGRRAAPIAHWLLGPMPQTHPRAAAASAGSDGFSRRLPLEGTNSEKTVGHGPLAQGH